VLTFEDTHHLGVIKVSEHCVVPWIDGDGFETKADPLARLAIRAETQILILEVGGVLTKTKLNPARGDQDNQYALDVGCERQIAQITFFLR
jgi:hypothetical protein